MNGTLKLLRNYCIAILAPALSVGPSALAEPGSPPTDPALSAYDSASDANERIWLPQNTGKVLAFYLKEQSGTAHGGVLIIPDRGKHPVVDDNTNALRHSLAQHHWHTLALDISALDAATIQQTIAAGIAALNERGVFNIALYAEGEAALHAIHYIAALPAPTPGQFQQIRALVMFNAANTATDVEQNAIAALATLQLPVLDAWYANDYREQSRAGERKAIAAPTSKLYQQARVPYASVQSPTRENRITKRIRGWLDNNIAGFMVDKNTGRDAP